MKFLNDEELCNMSINGCLALWAAASPVAGCSKEWLVRSMSSSLQDDIQHREFQVVPPSSTFQSRATG